MVDQDHKRYFYFTSVLSTPSTSFNIKYYIFLVTYSIDLLDLLKFVLLILCLLAGIRWQILMVMALKDVIL